jgi:hypothetical protein
MASTRRLAAILAADVAGYSRLRPRRPGNRFGGIVYLRRSLLEAAPPTHARVLEAG